MIKKFFKELKESIIEDYVFIIVCLLTVIIFNIPVNYYIITGGGIEDVGEKIAIKDSYNSRGSYNMCYVSEIRGRVGPYLLSYVIPSWDREKVSDYTYNDKETIKDVEFRDKLDLKVANSNALYWAYTLAGLETKMIKREKVEWGHLTIASAFLFLVVLTPLTHTAVKTLRLQSLANVSAMQQYPVMRLKT